MQAEYYMQVQIRAGFHLRIWEAETIRPHQINIPFHIPSLVTLSQKQTHMKLVPADSAALHNFEPHHNLHAGVVVSDDPPPPLQMTPVQRVHGGM